MELPLCLYYETCDEEGMVDQYFTGDVTDASGRVMCWCKSEEQALELVNGIDDLLASTAMLNARLEETDNLRERLAKAEAQVDVLKQAIVSCIDTANDRESEWGNRAIDSFKYLYDAISNTEGVKDDAR